MNDPRPIHDLGPRICVLGPSNSGKSTLAKKLADKLSSPVIHLDQLFHFPNSAWQPRPQDEFLSLHEQAISGDHWIIEGNYHRCLESRLARATGLIVLDVSFPVMMQRYFYRTLFQRERLGGVLTPGQRDRLSGEMLSYLIFKTAEKRKQNRNIFDQCPLPKIYLSSPAQVKEYCRAGFQY